MKIILIRHGQTIANRDGIWEGHGEGELTEKGIEQAKKLGEFLKNEKIDYAYSSDLKRAKDTVKYALTFHKDVPVEYTALLRESFLGVIEGKKDIVVDWNNPPKNAELFDGLIKRAKEFIKIIKEKEHSIILVSGHGGINKAIIAVFRGEEDFPRDFEQDNTCINIFEITDKGEMKVIKINSTEHLKS